MSKDELLEFPKMTRVEVINHYDGEGKGFTKWEDDLKVEVDIQDGGRTLKVFLSKKSEYIIESDSNYVDEKVKEFTNHLSKKSIDDMDQIFIN